jgi:hypothetical protein
VKSAFCLRIAILAGNIALIYQIFACTPVVQTILFINIICVLAMRIMELTGVGVDNIHTFEKCITTVTATVSTGLMYRLDLVVVGSS